MKDNLMKTNMKDVGELKLNKFLIYTFILILLNTVVFN